MQVIAEHLAAALNTTGVTTLTGDEEFLAEDPVYSCLDWDLAAAHGGPAHAVGLRAPDGSRALVRYDPNTGRWVGEPLPRSRRARRPSRVVVVAAALALIVAGAGYGVWRATASGGRGSSSSVGSKGHVVLGRVALNGSDNFLDLGSGCSGTGGYDDLRAGADVIIKDGNGSIIATTSLQNGSPSTVSCTFEFAATNVPNTAFYQFGITHRSAPTYSQAEMESNDWTVAFTIGS